MRDYTTQYKNYIQHKQKVRCKKYIKRFIIFAESVNAPIHEWKQLFDEYEEILFCDARVKPRTITAYRTEINDFITYTQRGEQKI